MWDSINIIDVSKFLFKCECGVDGEYGEIENYELEEFLPSLLGKTVEVSGNAAAWSALSGGAIDLFYLVDRMYSCFYAVFDCCLINYTVSSSQSYSWIF